MKKSLLLLLICITSATAQKKYQSLLWEISGNGLTKNSYLYGSMHVSEKVSYHLSDAFFKHLLASDYVANESDPSSWIAIFDVLNMPSDYNYQQQGKFYTQFYQQPIRKEQLYPLFVSNNYTMNSILFRTSEHQQDFQEDTYLDMFIHQTGKKYKKQTVGLEDAKQSMISMMNIENDEIRPREENMQAIMKLLKDKSFDQALLDYYREKNLDMIDSIYTLLAPENYLKALLYDRNIIMTKSIDSIARKGSLFAAIGAAHLPGKLGVIEKLRDLGYTVTPITDQYTEKGKRIKKEIDGYFIKPEFKITKTGDAMVALPMNPQIVSAGEDISTPDLANGGVINLKRIPLRNYLRKDNAAFSPHTLDSLFYENIPGEIIEKRFFTENNYSGFDIRNRTTSGNAQHYRYYITPLELICVSMSGNNDYVRKYESEIFNNIKLRSATSGWESVTPEKGGFSINVPGYYSLYGNRNSSNPSDFSLEAYDSADNSYYFLIERTLSDHENLEETAFELKRIHREFYTKLKITQAVPVAKDGGYESTSMIGNQPIRIRTELKGAKYYLLGTVGSSNEATAKFFDSFQPAPFVYTDSNRTFTDSTAYFSVSIPEKQNEKLFWKKEQRKQQPASGKENTFIGKSNQYVFTAASGKAVHLRFLQYHRYAGEKNLDSVWEYHRAMITKDFESHEYEFHGQQSTLDDPSLYRKKGFSKSTWYHAIGITAERKRNKLELSKEKITYNKEQQFHQIDVMATTKESANAIKYRGIFKNGLTYWISAVVDKNYSGTDAFIENTFDSFRLVRPDTSNAVFSNKVDLFLSDAVSEDENIRYSALQSIYMLRPEKDDLPKLSRFLSTFNYRPDEIESLTDLLEKIGHIQDPHVIPLLENQYKKANGNTIIQFAVLRALANNRSKQAYKSIVDLLEFDLPLSDNGYDINGIFSYFSDDLPNSQVIFPDILQFYTIDEYHDPILDFTSKLFESDFINPRKIGSYKKMILTHAKLEYKRLASWKAKDLARNSSQNSYNPPAPIDDLVQYLEILIKFKKDGGIMDLLQKIANLNIAEMDIEMARLEVTNNGKFAADRQNDLLQNPKTAFLAFQLLHNAEEEQLISKWTDEQIATAAISHYEAIDSKKDSLEFIEKRIVNAGGKSATFYFYTVTKNADADYNPYGMPNKILTGIAFVNNKDRIDPQSFRYLKSASFGDTDDLPRQMNAQIDEALNSHRLRATFDFSDDTNYMHYTNDGY